MDTGEHQTEPRLSRRRPTGGASKKGRADRRPILRHIANLWSLVGYPSAKKEWSLKQKLQAVKAAGFDGFTTQLTPEHAKLGERLGLIRIGYFSSGDGEQFERLLAEQKKCGAFHVNVQLADHDTPTPEAVELAKRLMAAGRKVGVQPSVEVHRDTCTETPEKTFAMADAYQRQTGELLTMTWDHSHPAIIKHLAPPYWERLGVRLDLFQTAHQFHFRPFNGHHCQIPVTDGQAKLTPELLEYLPFVEQLMRAWLGKGRRGGELYAVPEMGPVASGYNLHSLPNSWEEAKVLRGQIEMCWKRALRG